MRKEIARYVKDNCKTGMTMQELFDCIERYFEINGYPLRIDEEDVIHLISDDAARDDLPLGELHPITHRLRKKDEKSNRPLYSFSRFDTAPSIEKMTVQEIVDRRTSGITIRADESLDDIRKAGYMTVNEAMQAYESAKATVDKLQWIIHRYNYLTEQEKEAIK